MTKKDGLLLAPEEQGIDWTDNNGEATEWVKLHRGEVEGLLQTQMAKVKQCCEPYSGALYSAHSELCLWCKTPTHWLDLFFEAPICSQRCQDDIARDIEKREVQLSNSQSNI